MSGGFLKSPRVRVVWGDINLTAYDGASKGAPEVFTLDSEKGGPIVYDVKISLSSEGNGPTAEFKWDPTGPGYAAYEWFISQPKYVLGRFSIEFFYPRGKKIVTFFRWSGQSINYGNDMSVTVKLQSELAGLVNANQRSIAQAYDEKKGAEITQAYAKTTQQYGLTDYPDILAYNKYAKEQMKKVKLESVYGTDQTYGAAISNLAKQAGHQAVVNNIGSSGIIIYPPYSWGPDQEVLDGVTDIGADQAPDPKIRYGYLLGPSLIKSVSRNYNWKPPQQEKSKSGATQTKPGPLRDPATGRFVSSQEQNQANTRQPTSSPLATANARPNPGVRNKDNPNGPDRQLALEEEKSSELSFQTFMCPALVGLKPNDIVFIPSLKGDFMEDWIVQSVDYTQNNGAVEISVRATRIFGAKEEMNQTAADKFLAAAKQNKLVGSGATLDAWDAYAWGLPGG